MKIVVLDSEGDGLAYDCTKLHVMGWTVDGVNIHATGDYDEMRSVLIQPNTKFVCHNAVRHDLVVFNRVLNLNLDYSQFIDTLALSWTLNYDRAKHGLASYGEDFGVPKPEVEDWSYQPYEVYENRVIEDVKINWKLWKDLERKLGVLYGYEDSSSL